MKLEIDTTYALALHQTPTWLRLFGAPAWRFHIEVPHVISWHSKDVEYVTQWCYVDKAR